MPRAAAAAAAAPSWGIYRTSHTTFNFHAVCLTPYIFIHLFPAVEMSLCSLDLRKKKSNFQDCIHLEWKMFSWFVPCKTSSFRLIKILQSTCSFDSDMKQHAVGWQQTFCQHGLRQWAYHHHKHTGTKYIEHQGSQPAVLQRGFDHQTCSRLINQVTKLPKEVGALAFLPPAPQVVFNPPVSRHQDEELIILTSFRVSWKRHRS